VLVNRGVSRVVFLNSYRNDEGVAILRKANVDVVKYADLVDLPG
jgi:deoxycytidylate deaminase